MKFRGWEVQTQNITMTIIYISFKNLLTKKVTWHIHTTSFQ